MKTQFKYHIKFGSCWYDNFFKVDTRNSTFAKASVDERKNVKQLKTKSACAKASVDEKTLKK